MKNVYTNPVAEIIRLNTCDVIATSGVERRAEGIGDVASWLDR